MRTGEHLLYLFDQRTHVEAGEGGLLGRLQDHCVPAAQSWPQLPSCHHQGEVPLRKQRAEKLSPVLSLFPSGHGFIAAYRKLLTHSNVLVL